MRIDKILALVNTGIFMHALYASFRNISDVAKYIRNYYKIMNLYRRI